MASFRGGKRADEEIFARKAAENVRRQPIKCSKTQTILAYREKSFSYTNQYGYVSRLREQGVSFMDPQLLYGLAAVLSALATLVWAWRRNPDLDDEQ